MKDRTFIILIFNIRKNLPSSSKFYYIYFALKFIGLILTTQNLKDYESKNNKITSIHSILSKFSLFDSSFYIISKYYQLICIIIFTLIILFILYFILIYYRLKNIYINLKSKEDFNLIKYYDITKYIKIEIKIFTYIFIVITFLSQYILEYLFFGIIISFLNKNDLKSDKFLISFITDEIFHKSILILNMISFFIIFLSNLFFLFLNDTKGFLSKYGCDIFSNKPIKILTLFLSMFQPLLICSYLFKDSIKENVRITICIIAVLLSLIFILLSIRKFNYYYDSKIPQFIFILVCFCCYGGIFELILIFIINDKKQMTQSYSSIKLILSISISIFIFYYIRLQNKFYFSNQLSINLFKEKNRDISEIYLYIKFYCMLREDSSNFELYKIFYNHRNKCLSKECFCELIKKRLNIKKFSNCLKKDEYSIIGEQEIVNIINYLYKSKKYKKEIENFILLHCQYIYAIRKRDYYALYLCSMYLNCNLKLNILTKYFIYETKKEILLKIQSNKDISKSNLVDGNKKNISRNLFYRIKKLKYVKHFIVFSENIKYLIRDMFKNLEKVLSFRKQVKKNSKLGRMNEKSFSYFLMTCGKVKKNDENIKQTIINYSKTRKKDNLIIKNNEISYILTNYFILLHKKIPKKVKYKFLYNYNFNEISNDLYKDFSEFNMNYPIIIAQTKSDNFVFNYIHTLLLNYLDYSQEEIKDKDINEFIPIDIRKQHNLNLKQFCFLHNPKFINTNTYILSKGNYLINISIYCRNLPTLYYFSNIITNVRIIQNDKNLSIFLDKKGYFMNTCKEFENIFFFDLKKIKQLSITFHDFFGIPPLEKKFNKHHFINLNEEDKAYIIFSSIPNQKMFSLRRKKKNVEELKRKKYHFSTYINKKNILNGINNINQILDEKGLDIEWYNITKCLLERFKNSQNNTNNKKKKKQRKSFVNDNEDRLFMIDYYLKEIGNKKYYTIKMTETTDINQLKKATYNLNQIIESHKKNNLLQTNTVQLTSKRSEASQLSSAQISSYTNIPLLQSPMKEFFINENNLNINNISKINELSSNNNNNNKSNNNSSNLNYSIMNNSKIPLGDDSKGISEFNIIQNLVNNQIGKIKQGKNQYKSQIYNLGPSKNISLTIDINEEKRKNKIREKFIENYTIFLFSSFGVVIALSVVLLILKLKKIYEYKDLYQFNIYMEILKSNTYLSALYSFTLCFETSLNSTSYNIQKFIEPKKQNLQDDLAKFNSYIDRIKTNNKLNMLYDYIYGKYNFTTIEKSWEISIRQSNILEEVKLILFYLYQIYFRENNTCNFMNSFFEKNYENLNENNIPPTQLEQFTFYGLQNTFQSFKSIFEKVTTHTSLILFDYYNSYFQFILFYGILIIFFTFICYFIILEKLTDDKNEIKKLLKHLFVIGGNNENQIIFEIQVSCFKIMCDNFKDDNIKKFEKSKNEYIDILIKKIHSKREGKKKNFDKQSFYSGKNNHKHKNDKTFNEESQNFEKNIYLPKSVSISYSILTFFLILISSIVIVNIFYAHHIKNTFIFSIIIAMNFLERIPKCFELVYYSIISFTLVDTSYLGNYENYDLNNLIDEYLNYYNTKIVFENNTQIYNMKESYYPILFVEGRMVENNIEIFLSKKTSILNNIKKIEKEFNTNDNLCYASSINSLNDIINYKISYIEYFSRISEKITLCYNNNFGSMKYGLLVEINYIYQEITNLFYDFIQSNNRAKTSINLFSLPDINRMTLDFNYVLEYVFKSYSYSVMKDIKNLYVKTIRLEMLLSSLLLIVLFFVVIYVFLLIGKGNYKYKKLLKFFYKMY